MLDPAAITAVLSSTPLAKNATKMAENSKSDEELAKERELKQMRQAKKNKTAEAFEESTRAASRNFSSVLSGALAEVNL